MTAPTITAKAGPNLSEAYWLYGVVANLAISIVVGAMWKTSIPPAPMTAWLGYNVWVQLLIWDAAVRYRGRPVWAGLAKAVVILDWALITVAALGTLAGLLHRLADLQSSKGVMEQLLW